MPSDNLKRHMEKHKILEIKTNVKQSSKCSINYERLKKEVIHQQEEFNRKLEIGKNLYDIINENGRVEAALTSVQVEALEIYETHGKNLNLGGIEW